MLMSIVSSGALVVFWSGCEGVVLSGLGASRERPGRAGGNSGGPRGGRFQAAHQRTGELVERGGMVDGDRPRHRGASHGARSAAVSGI
jgi:hypothetical protein